MTKINGSGKRKTTLKRGQDGSDIPEASTITDEMTCWLTSDYIWNDDMGVC